MESQEKTGEPSRSAPGRTFGQRRAAMRMIQDAELGAVLVYELDPAPGQRFRTLIYESRFVCSCIDHVPEEWPRLSDEELIALVR